MVSYMAHCQSGDYGYDRMVTVHENLREHPYAQCGIIRMEHGKQFVSYETIVCEIEDDWLHVYGTFSATTAKQIGWFLRQMKKDYNYRIDLATYQTAKKCYQKGIKINLYSGDERPASDGIIQTVGVKP